MTLIQNLISKERFNDQKRHLFKISTSQAFDDLNQGWKNVRPNGRAVPGRE